MKPWLEDYINDREKEGFTGSIRINFFKGGISNVNMDTDDLICPKCGGEKIRVEKKQTLKEGEG